MRSSRATSFAYMHHQQGRLSCSADSDHVCASLQGNSHKVGGTLIRSSKLELQEGQVPEPPNLYQPLQALPGAALAASF
jgi:hypothetical protein